MREAKQIVLEAEGVRIDTYDRYLAFVWVDGVLLNLELVQQAYTEFLYLVAVSILRYLLMWKMK